MKQLFFTFLPALLPLFSYGQCPTRLTTDLIEHTDRVFIGGYPSTMSLADAGSAIEPWQVAEIRTARPTLGWVVNGPASTVQRACRILVASSEALLHEGKADMWDSGRMEGPNSSTVGYCGEPLKPSTVYYWKVKTWDNHGTESGYSAARAFMTAAVLDDGVSFSPLTKTDGRPVAVSRTDAGGSLLDFGTDAFAQLSLTLTATGDADTVTVHLGEQCAGGRVNRRPEGSQRYACYRLPLLRGTHTYRVKIRKDRRNTAPKQNESGVDPVFMPGYVGEVYPFRYCEIEGYGGSLSCGDAVRHVVSYPFDASAASFTSSDSILNKVWDLCRHTVMATSFAGIYVDGDRERIPYEADAIINQLSHYAADRDFAMARRSVRHLIYNPTWPTEWILQSVIMAWNDYMYTGDARLLVSVYGDLKAKTLLALRDGNGLISTRTGRAGRELYRTIHFKGKGIRDIVDWPQTGAAGVEKESGGEADGFVFTDYNTVVNAYHYEALSLMERIAGVLGNKADEAFYRGEAQRAAKAINTLLTDPATGLYKDGADTDHKSLHSNMFALCFGLVDKRRERAVTDFIKSRRMGCSVYGAQFLLDALYDAGEAGYALSLLNSVERRSWYNMLRIGSTITTEAWDNVFKPNQDWNHPWGAAPLNVISRKLMGIEPLTPGFGRMRIKPQPGPLAEASIDVPTVKGTVSVAFSNVPGSRFTLDADIPANTTADVYLPLLSRHCTVDGVKTKGRADGRFLVVTVGSGRHHFEIAR